ncbi:MAG: phosphoribosylglycinamide formyltransferase [Prevotellaceae bacterium]|jgi:phosphoribosylglycinamide formyltransferase-1|nr:phosphoribosylglycinamide formyltransferase [Prevotellaceae bacterium]
MFILALFASGAGTNVENIINYFNPPTKNITVGAVFANNPHAGAIERAQRAGIPVHIFNRNDFYHTGNVLEKLQEYRIDAIVLAGFLWLAPDRLIQLFPHRILNIHPALLPAYGGKGMYGMHVHRAVIANRERESGITIHEVNSEYDSGKIIFQTACAITPGDTPETLAAKVRRLEYQHFPRVIEEWANSLMDA